MHYIFPLLYVPPTYNTYSCTGTTTTTISYTGDLLASCQPESSGFSGETPLSYVLGDSGKVHMVLELLDKLELSSDHEPGDEPEDEL